MGVGGIYFGGEDIFSHDAVLAAKNVTAQTEGQIHDLDLIVLHSTN